MKRRHFLLAGGLLGAGTYINHRGLRYPRMSFEPANPASSFTINSTQLKLTDLILRPTTEPTNLNFRAIAPEPKLVIAQDKQSENDFTIRVSNISEMASLKAEASPNVEIHEQITGTNRVLEINNNQDQEVILSWFFPDSNQVSFAAIGDSGGGDELDWCLTRAQQLDVDFLLHLGDFHYTDGEYDRAIRQFNNAPMPVYVSIGNHDYNDSGLIYEHFLNHIGPMNNSFIIAGTRFMNIDTAANFLPAYAGNRGSHLRQVKKSAQTVSDHVVFTHKPFVDSRTGEDHDISGVGEKSWLYNTMQELGANDLLCGHVHLSTERDYEGVRQWTAGEGLGYEDILEQAQVSKMLIGNITPGAKVAYHWEPLNMPWSLHTSPTHREKLLKDGHTKQLDWLQKLQTEAKSNST